MKFKLGRSRLKAGASLSKKAHSATGEVKKSNSPPNVIDPQKDF